MRTAASTTSSGSARRPFPIQPHARYPSPGSTNRTPRPARIRRFSCTAGCASMFVFIAGASSTGALVARNRELRKSSARPWANLAMTLAVHGATSSRAARSAMAMCSMSRELDPESGRAPNWDVMTGCLVIASKVSGPTNFVADRVITATTSCPRFCSPRHTSTAL